MLVSFEMKQLSLKGKTADLMTPELQPTEDDSYELQTEMPLNVREYNIDKVFPMKEKIQKIAAI